MPSHSIEFSRQSLRLENSQNRQFENLLSLSNTNFSSTRAVSNPLIIKKKSEGRGASRSTTLKTSELFPQHTSLASVLKVQPSVLVTDFGGKGQAKIIQVRGSSAAQLPIIVDNMPLHNHSGKTDISMLPLDVFSSIKFQRGMASALNSQGSMAGAIHLTSKTQDANHITIETAAFGEFNFKTFVNLPFESVFLYKRGAYSGNFIFKNDRGTQFNTADDFLDVRRNNDYTSDLYQIYSKALPNIEILANTFIADNGSPGTVVTPASSARRKSRRSYAWAKMSELWLEPQVYTVQHMRDFTDPLGELAGAPYAISQSESRTGLNLNHDFLFGRKKLNLNIGMSQESFGQSTQSSLIRRTVANVEASYMLGRILPHVFTNVHIQAGGVQENQGSRMPIMVSAKLANKWKMSKTASMVFSFGSGYRFPSLAEKYDRYGLLYANPDLLPEQGVEAEWGLDIASKYSRLSSTIYARRVTNLIRFEIRSGSFMSYENVGAADVVGWENAADLQSDIAHIKGQLNVIYGEDTSNGSKELLTLSPIVSHVTISPSKPIYVLDTWSINPSMTVFYENRSIANNKTTVHIPDKLQMDIGLDIRTSKDSSGWEIGGSIKNVTDQLIQDKFGYPLPGRMWRLHAKLNV